MEGLLILAAIIIGPIILFSKLAEWSDRKKEKKDFIAWFEQNSFYDSLSPVINAYRRTGRLDPKYYDIDGELRSLIGTSEGLYYWNHGRPGAYFDDWKETILTYRKALIENLDKGKDYPTRKGTIRIVPIADHHNGLRLWGIGLNKDPYCQISPRTLLFRGNERVPKAYTDILGHFGFTFIQGLKIDDEGWMDFEVVAYINLGK